MTLYPTATVLDRLIAFSRDHAIPLEEAYSRVLSSGLDSLELGPSLPSFELHSLAVENFARISCNCLS